MIWLAELAIVALAQAVPASPMAGMAQASVPCPATAGWSPARTIAAGVHLRGAPALALGSAIGAVLPQIALVAYALPPAKPGAATSHGGLIAFVVGDPGRYRVALGAAAWIDVVREGRLIESVAHDHGPDCSGIRKTVDFDLRPGRYLLQIAGATAATLPLMVSRVP